MRQTLLAAAAAFVIGGIATGAVLSQAQPAPPAPSQDQPAAPPAHAGDGGDQGMMGWRHHMMREGMLHGGMMHEGMMRGGMMHRPFGPGTLALIYRQEDRALKPADVQKIAEAFLLWNGNHTWKVSDVAPTADGPIGFSLTTPDGSAVARFTMDPHTGRIQRVG